MSVEFSKSQIPKAYDKKKSRLRREMFLVMRKYSVNSDFIRLIRYLRKIIVRQKERIKSLKYDLKISCKTNGGSEDKIISEKAVSAEPLTENDLIKVGNSGWLVQDEASESLSEDKKEEQNTKAISLADQVKEAAEAAMQQIGMVFDETSGLYYDYKTGYYYNPELGLYYHSSTGCYYYFSEEQNQFVYHSHADISQYTGTMNASEHRRKKRSAKHKQKNDKGNKRKGQSSDSDDSRSKRKIRKKERKNSKDNHEGPCQLIHKSELKTTKVENIGDKNLAKDVSIAAVDSNEEKTKLETKIELELEEGEYSSSDVESSDQESSDNSTSSESDEAVAKNYPPSMRVIVQETMVATLKKGSLFLLTKDGGTLGREGNTHSIFIADENISRHHLTFTYDEDKSVYNVVDLGSRNGTFLNGKRLSVSKQESDKHEIVHGSTLELGSTKLLCHIHPGNDTCGHCEPGLVMADTEKPVNQVRRVNLLKEHKAELQRLKSKYAPTLKEKCEVGEKASQYKDRALVRRKVVGSSHSSVKTEQTSLDTGIAPTNKGFKMLSKMGWSFGEGLGKNAQGEVQPVALVSNTGAMGLGSGGLATPAGDAPIVQPLSNKRTTVWLKTQKRFDAAAKPSIFEEPDSEEEHPNT